jgi:hypothetical protein
MKTTIPIISRNSSVAAQKTYFMPSSPHTGTLAWHTEAEHPGWTATYELLRPYLNQAMRAATLPPVARILQRQLRLHR